MFVSAKEGNVFGGFLLGALLMCTPPGVAAARVGELAPPLELQTVDGQWQRLQDYRGKVVYVDFWASWCAPCRQSLPQYERLFRKWAASDFGVLAVNVDTERRVAVAALKQSAVSFPVVFDPGGIWAERFKLPTMPSGYLIDRKGVVRYIHSGYRAEELPVFEAWVIKILEEK